MCFGQPPFALAVVLDRGPATFLAHPPLLAFSVVTAILILASCATNVSLGPGLREDRANRWVPPAFGVLGIAIALVPAWCDRVDLMTIDGDATRWLGVVLYAAGGWLRSGRSSCSDAASARWSRSSLATP